MVTRTAKALLCAGALAALALVSGCDQSPRHHLHTQAETVYHFSDGRYGYQDSSGFWFYLWLAQSGSSSTRTVYYTGPSPASSGSATSSAPAATPVAQVPAGAVWAKGVAPSAQELKEAEPEEMAVEMTEAGEPATAEEVAEAAAEPVAANDNAPQAEGEHQGAGAPEGEHGAEPASEPASEPSSESSSSGDSGSSSSD